MTRSKSLIATMPDLSKRPAPWVSDKDYYVWDADGCYVASGNDQDVADGIALARNALDVMMRRGWYAVHWEHDGKWTVCTNGQAQKFPSELWDSWRALKFADPFTALVEADKWYVANVENPAP